MYTLPVMKNMILVSVLALLGVSCTATANPEYNTGKDFCDMLVTPDMTVKRVESSVDPASSLVKHVSGKAILDGSVEYDFWFVIDENGDVILMSLTDAEEGVKLLENTYTVTDKGAIEMVKEMYTVGR